MGDMCSRAESKWGGQEREASPKRGTFVACLHRQTSKRKRATATVSVSSMVQRMKECKERMEVVLSIRKGVLHKVGVGGSSELAIPINERAVAEQMQRRTSNHHNPVR